MCAGEDACSPKLHGLRSGGLKLQTSLGEKDLEIPTSVEKLGTMVHACHPSDHRQPKIGVLRPAWAKREVLFPK
jgi:hypothetical protein